NLEVHHGHVRQSGRATHDELRQVLCVAQSDQSVRGPAQELAAVPDFSRLEPARGHHGHTYAHTEKRYGRPQSRLLDAGSIYRADRRHGDDLRHERRRLCQNFHFDQEAERRASPRHPFEPRAPWLCAVVGGSTYVGYATLFGTQYLTQYDTLKD